MILIQHENLILEQHECRDNMDTFPAFSFLRVHVRDEKALEQIHQKVVQFTESVYRTFDDYVHERGQSDFSKISDDNYRAKLIEYYFWYLCLCLGKDCPEPDTTIYQASCDEKSWAEDMVVDGFLFDIKTCGSYHDGKPHETRSWIVQKASTKGYFSRINTDTKFYGDLLDGDWEPSDSVFLVGTSLHDYGVFDIYCCTSAKTLVENNLRQKPLTEGLRKSKGAIYMSSSNWLVTASLSDLSLDQRYGPLLDWIKTG